jgi:hypothetical protein
LINGLWLGRKQERMAVAEAAPDSKPVEVQGSSLP